jgi:amino acid permease
LTIPGVFEKTGILGGILLYSSIAAMNTYTMNTMMIVAHKMSKRKNEAGELKQIKSYSALSRRMHGLYGEILVDIMMFVVQFSCCVGYLYFIANIL